MNRKYKPEFTMKEEQNLQPGGVRRLKRLGSTL